MATTLRNDAKAEIINILRKQGYPTYARLVSLFDIYLSDDPEVIGYMIPGQAKIVLNKDLSITQVSTIVRHEILHEYFTHGPRQQKFDKEHPELNPQLAGQVANIAADYDISNKGYTNADKSTVRSIRLNDKVLRGLVTEDDHPDWAELSFEEMYEKLLEQDKEDREQMKDLLDRIQDLNKQDLDDMQKDLDDIQSSMDNQQSKGQEGSSSNSNSTQSVGSGGSEEDDDSDPQKDSGGASKVDKQAEKLKDEVSDLQKELSDASQEAEKSSNVFDTPKEQRDKADVAARAKQIRDLINDLKEQAKAVEESQVAIRKEIASKAAKDVERYQGSGLQQFKLNLNRFIADQIGENDDDSYSRIHPSYEDSEFILPGKIVREEKSVPLINVYHDVSGSFSSASKTAAAFKAIESLNQYVRDGDIEIKVYYFADRVSDSRNNAGGGTYGTPILDHIELTKPTNVIVITDADIRDCSRVVTVPGAVWMLFYDARSENLMEHLRGKRQNKYYDIAY